ncbi:MAG: hypothetical protein JSU02_10720 [Bacteroidetes bacterium]|nr:hypothetical protein [Bacteroidota bacterium]
MGTCMHLGVFHAAALAGLFAVSCGNAGQQSAPDEQAIAKQQAKADSTRKAFEADYRPVMNDLAALRDSINAKLATVNADLAKMKPGSKQLVQKEAFKAEITSEQTLVNDAIAKIDDATETTWGDFREEAHAAAQQAKNWWAGLKDDKAIVTKVNGGR